MDFAEGLAAMVDGVIGIAVARNHARGFVADHFRSLLGFGVDDDLVGTVNLVVGENAVLEHEPSRSPSFPVIHPLVQYSGDSVPDEVVDLHVHHRLLPLAPAVAVAVLVAVTRSRIGSHGGGGGGGGERRHGEVRERGFYRRGLVGNGGHAAERMHEEEREYIYITAAKAVLRRGGVGGGGWRWRRSGEASC